MKTNLGFRQFATIPRLQGSFPGSLTSKSDRQRLYVATLSLKRAVRRHARATGGQGTDACTESVGRVRCGVKLRHGHGGRASNSPGQAHRA